VDGRHSGNSDDGPACFGRKVGGAYFFCSSEDWELLPLDFENGHIDDVE